MSRPLQMGLGTEVTSETPLVVEWCKYGDAEHAVMNWHYSRRMPRGRLYKFCAYENGLFVGAVIYGNPVSFNTGKRFGLTHRSVLELVRVALTSHKSPVSQIVAQSVKMLRRENPQLELLVSYADPEQNHNGTIYQAMNWIYDGITNGEYLYEIDGQQLHGRTLSHRYGTRSGYDEVKVWKPGKHRYYLPLTRQLKRLIKPTASYPK